MLFSKNKESSAFINKLTDDIILLERLIENLLKNFDRIEQNKNFV